jgi:hypothetical protein
VAEVEVLVLLEQMEQLEELVELVVMDFQVVLQVLQ